MRQAETSSFLQGLHHHMNVTTQEHGLSLGMYEASILSFLVILTALFQSGGSLVWFTVVLLSMESSAQWHTNKWDILNPFNKMENFSILLSLITFMI